jgi:hypothetical protein
MVVNLIAHETMLAVDLFTGQQEQATHQPRAQGPRALKTYSYDAHADR